MKCPKCGKTLNDGSKFCDQCGTPLEPVAEEQIPEAEKVVGVKEEPKQPEVQTQASTQKKNSKLKTGLIVGTVVAVLGGATVFGVSSATATPTIKLADYTIVEVSGYDGLGEATVTIDWDAIEAKCGDRINYSKKMLEELEKIGATESTTSKEEIFAALEIAVSYDCDNVSDLSNGDTITVEYTTGYDVDDYFTCEIDTTDLEYEVNGLEEVDKFDAFANLELEYSGVSGEASLSYDYKGDEDMYFDCDNTGYLSNGDEVTITIEIDDATAFIDKYGHIPKEMSKTYTVEGLETYCDSIDAIPQAAKEEMRAEADDAIVSKIASTRSSTSKTVGNATYIGDYMMSMKTSASPWYSSGKNIYGVVYKFSVDNEMRYVGVQFSDISSNEEGEYTVDLNNTYLCGTFMMAFSGNTTLESYKNDYVDTKTSTYTIEWNVQE